MTILRTTINQPIYKGWRPAVSRGSIGRLFVLLLVTALSAGILLNWEQIQRLGIYGYPAVFFVSLFGNAVLFLPAPSFVLVLAAGASLDPLMVGLVAGLGAAIGEMTGYLAGYSGQVVLQDRPLYNRIKGWMSTKGVMVVFALAAIPNPVFDIGGIVAGASHMPAWKFLTATWLGKSLRFALLAGIGVLAAG